MSISLYPYYLLFLALRLCPCVADVDVLSAFLFMEGLPNAPVLGLANEPNPGVSEAADTGVLGVEVPNNDEEGVLVDEEKRVLGVLIPSPVPNNDDGAAEDVLDEPNEATGVAVGPNMPVAGVDGVVVGVKNDVLAAGVDVVVPKLVVGVAVGVEKNEGVEGWGVEGVAVSVLL